MTRPFSDLITPRADGGLDILVDHPAGPLRWELPGADLKELERLQSAPRLAELERENSDLRERVLRAETSEEEWGRRYDTALHDADEMRKAWEEAERENEVLRNGLGEALDRIKAVADDVPGSESWDRFDELRKLTAEPPDGE